MGIWLGIDRRTGQYIIFDQDQGGIRHTRTIMRMPVGHEWSKQRLEAVNVTPWSIHGKPPPHIEHQAPAAREPDPGHRPIVRRLYLKPGDF